ncbi:MAG: hypothetical protein JRI25_18605 [Deltaproteobacteria bacterium]|nr:hypothetical protein [Deltaproteobacteria bacterium]
MRFFHVTDPGQVEVRDRLRSACEVREIPCLECIPGRAVPAQPRAGDAMYRSTGSAIGVRMELDLYVDGMATFYADRERLLTDARNPWFSLRDAGVPVVRAISTVPLEASQMQEAVDDLGGFPIVIKVFGGHTGIGVMRVETPTALQALLILLARKNKWPLLMEFFPLVAAHRLTVIGDEVHGPYSKRPSPDDFRTNARESIDEGPFEPRQEILDLSLQTARAVRMEFGGVDILEDKEGRLVVTEINNPCYFVRQEDITGVDISGLMMDHLSQKARRLSA